LIRTNLTIDDPADAPLDGERRASRDAPAEPATATEAPALSAEHRWLEGLYRRYHHPRFIEPDPLAVVRRCGDPADREVVGLLAASLAYGNVKAILGGLADALDRLAADPDPASADAGSGSGAGAARALLDATPATLRRRFADYRYRVSSGAQVAGLLIGARTLIRRHGSLARSFAAAAGPALDARPAGGAPAATGDAANPGDNVHRGAADEAAAVCAAVGRWVESLHAAAGASLAHLLPLPAKASACKRLFLYLRWMVRRDAVDPGGWDAPRPDQLIVPLDTHMHAIARRLAWTDRKQANLPAALEVTAALRRHRPGDPLRYDFALTRPGIRREPMPHLAPQRP